MKAPANCRLIGRWRIVESDSLGSSSSRSERPGDADNHRKAAKSPSAPWRAASKSNTPANSIGFHWAGCEKGDEVEGEGTAELLDDGTIEIEFAYRNGDEAVLKAKRDPSSTACLERAAFG